MPTRNAVELTQRENSSLWASSPDKRRLDLGVNVLEVLEKTQGQSARGLTAEQKKRVSIFETPISPELLATVID